MITVIIPVLNEEQTVGKVVNFAKSVKHVKQVIVVDDKSVDNTVAEAQKAGATVITSTKLGKGASMKDGLSIAQQPIVAFLDGDVDPYPPHSLEKLTFPIIIDECDFVKASFAREAGRVTELVAKPLLSIVYPELLRFPQPLSGMIASKKSLLDKIEFENDYGVDIGILIDVFRGGARIQEVNIGEIHHKMKAWQELGNMSREVAKAILKRAQPGTNMSLDSLATISLIRDQMDFAIKEAIIHLDKMVMFDLDDTIFRGRFIYKCAEQYGFKDQLIDIVTKNPEEYLTIKHIATLMKGLDLGKILGVVENIPMVEDVKEVIAELKKRGYVVGIITDGYDVVVNHVKNKIGADFSLSNELEFSGGVCTGEVKVPSFFMKNDKSLCHHNYCKSNALLSVAEKYNITSSNIIAIGDSGNDICALKLAGIGVAFCSNNSTLNMVADKKITTPSFKPLLDFAF